MSANILISGYVFTSTVTYGSTTNSWLILSENKHDLVRGTAPHFLQKFRFASILNPSVIVSLHSTLIIPSNLHPKTSNVDQLSCVSYKCQILLRINSLSSA